MSKIVSMNVENQIETKTLVDRIEKALSAADHMAELALNMNEGIENEGMRDAIRAYVGAARGVDLRPFRNRIEDRVGG